MKNFAGAYTALATPFKQGELDKASLKKLIRYQLDGGIEGLVISGTTGESPTLEWDEVIEVFKVVKSENANQVPLLVGTGSNSTKKTIENSIKAQEMGADGLLVVTPYYNKPPQRGLVAHFKAVAESVSIPVLLYNVPGRTAVSLGAEATIELSRVPNVVGVKDATADMELGESIMKGTGAEFNVTSGDDFTFVDLALRGGQGVISVLSNILPSGTQELLARGRKKDKTALSDYEKYRRITELLFSEANPIPVKAALNLMGIFESDEMRLPLCPLEAGKKAQLKDELIKLGLIK